MYPRDPRDPSRDPRDPRDPRYLGPPRPRPSRPPRPPPHPARGWPTPPGYQGPIHPAAAFQPHWSHGPMHLHPQPLPRYSPSFPPNVSSAFFRNRRPTYPSITHSSSSTNNSPASYSAPPPSMTIPEISFPPTICSTVSTPPSSSVSVSTPAAQSAAAQSSSPAPPITNTDNSLLPTTDPSSSAEPDPPPTPDLKQRLRSGARRTTQTTVEISSDEDEHSVEHDPAYEYGKRSRKGKKKSPTRKPELKLNKRFSTNWREIVNDTPPPNKKSKVNKVPLVLPSTSKTSSKSLKHMTVMFHNNSLDEKMVDRVLSSITEGGKTHWNDVCGLRSAKQRLKEMVVYPMLNPALFQGLRRPGRGLLLFGPPGTGKTLIGKCLATEAKATFFSITASSFGSKWYGEAESLAKTLFECARALQPSIIFIDEVDSILRSARDSDGGCSSRLRTELLACMDGCSTTGKEDVLVVGATNWPGRIDEAARRRFTRRLYIPLPDLETRIEQFNHELKNEKHSITEEDLQILALRTEGYSGADITQVCRNAAMKPIRSLDPNGISIEFLTMDDVRPMNHEDFMESIEETPRSVSNDMIVQLEEFNKQFGSL